MDILPASSSTPRVSSTSALSLSYIVPVVVKISPIEIEKLPFQPVTDNVSHSSSTPRTASTSALSPRYALPPGLLPIYVSKERSRQKTDYIIPRVQIENSIYLNYVRSLNYFRDIAQNTIDLNIN